MGDRCRTCGFPVEDHPQGHFCQLVQDMDWRTSSLQKQINQMGLHIQAMKIKVIDTKPAHKKTYYLACPYSSDKDAVRWMRMSMASEAAARLMSHDCVVYSPITHGHHLAAHLPTEILQDHDFWMGQCLPFVEWADVFALLPLNGWEKSKGVWEELELARKLGKPIVILQFPGMPTCRFFTHAEAEEAFGPNSLLEVL